MELLLHDTPPSLNQVGSRGHWRRWHGLKKGWQRDLGMLLLAERCPQGLARVVATATLSFPDKRRRDSDNYTALLAKSLGDALVTGGHLADDTPDFYRFDPVTIEVVPGRRRRTLVRLEVTAP